MPRRKKAKMEGEYECANCHRYFPAVRDDAQTCGPRCRKQLSREKQQLAAGRDAMVALRSKGGVECASCGTTRDKRVSKCPVCRSTKKK